MLLMILATLAAAAQRLPTVKEQAAIKQAVGLQLKDPASAQYKWQKVKPGAIYCAEVNSKNSYGGYAGFAPFMLIINSKVGPSDILGGALVANHVSPETIVTVSKSCQEAGYFAN
jgi:hypothetical protein